MASRRAFLAGMLASGLAPMPSWADAGSPAFLSAARFPDGSYRLVGLSARGEALFKLPLPGRGHAAAAHPSKPQAVAFARRPGTFALVIDCASGQQVAQLDAPEGRHFYGHGAFSADGETLFTAENDYEAGDGIIGIWDVTAGYARIGAFAAGGVGPHDVKLMPNGATLVIANGGIETHPDMGRTKLNLPTMRPNLSYASLSGQILEQVELAPDLHKNSIRHLAVGADGLVAFGMQWQGDTTDHPPLLGLHRRAQAARLLQATPEDHRLLAGYVGSVAISQLENRVAVTSPRGGVIELFDLGTGHYAGRRDITDVCGIADGQAGFVFSSGDGSVGSFHGIEAAQTARLRCQWDNHLVPISHPM